MKIRLILLITYFISIYGYAQSIDKFSIDSGGANASAGGIEMLYTIGEVNVAEHNSATLSLSEGFINAGLKIKIELLALLQGPLLSPTAPGLMNDDLRAGNHLPTISPYADDATVDVSVFSVTGSDAIVDWVWVELRQANDNTKIVTAKSALLQRQGLIVGLDGVSNLEMSASPSDYYVVVKHRNHLGVMSANPIALNEDETVVDFIDSGFSTFGSNAQVQLASGSMALWAGDINNSGEIKFIGTNSDANAVKDYILNDSSNILNFITYSSTGYLNIDVDMDGIGKFIGTTNDSSVIKDAVLAHPNNILNFITYTILSTLP